VISILKSSQLAARNKFKAEQHIPSYSNHTGNIEWWRYPGAIADVLSEVKVGVKPNLTALPPANSRRYPWAPASLDKTIAEYLALGEVRRKTQQETQENRNWSTVFRRSKEDSGNTRMITDQLQLNSNRRRMPVTEPPADVGSGGLPV